ncbi:MAG: GvpL/GvpF family gas vesicle protein [Deltaproteobacteria bacterium]|nr:GvpL/GvpF family gas vesicle protein [Deltaproteobacteria bacterium]
MSLYLYGVIDSQDKVALGPIGFDRQQVEILPAGRLAAMVGPSPQEDFFHMPKEKLVGLLLSHQQTLETVMKRFFVLPFKFGTTLKDESEATRILQEGREALTKLMGQMKGCTEIDVIATWDVKKTLQEIAEEDPEIAACKKAVTHGHTNGDVAFVGMLLAKALKQRAEQWKGEITQALFNYNVAPHDLLNDTMILNSSFLVPHQEEKNFMTKLEKVDAHFGGKIHFKCVGPLPPYSFATIMIKRFDPVQIQQAAAMLRLNGRTELLELKKIYRQLSKEFHPDHCLKPSQNEAGFEDINKAYEMVADYCKDGPKSLERAAVESFSRLEVCAAQQESHCAA